MRDGWFYNDADKPIGPFSIDVLISYIRRHADPHNVKVWNTGSANWRLAKDVPQIAELISRPPSISKNKPHDAASFKTATTTIESKQKAQRRLVAFLIVLVIAIFVGAIFTNFIYDDPSQIDQALKTHPSNSFLKLVTGANKIGEETSRAIARWSHETEPSAIAKDTSFATATRADLQAYLRNFKTAEAKTVVAMPRFVAILKKERAEMESLSRSLNISDSTRRDFLSGVDQRHARYSAFNSNMLAARGELYRAFQNYVTFLMWQYGKYKVEPNGQFRFDDRLALDWFNATVNALNVATKKVNELDVEQQQMEQSGPKEWDRIRSGMGE